MHPPVSRARDERLELVVGQSWCFSGQHRQHRSSARGAGRVRGRRRLRGSHQQGRGGTLDSNPELWTVPLAGRPAAVRAPSRSSRLEQKPRGRFSAGGLQWRPRARHLPAPRALLTIASYRVRPRPRQLSRELEVAMAQWIRRDASVKMRTFKTTDLEIQFTRILRVRTWFESL